MVTRLAQQVRRRREARARDAAERVVQEPSADPTADIDRLEAIDALLAPLPRPRYRPVLVAAASALLCAILVWLAWSGDFGFVDRELSSEAASLDQKAAGTSHSLPLMVANPTSWQPGTGGMECFLLSLPLVSSLVGRPRQGHRSGQPEIGRRQGPGQVSRRELQRREAARRTRPRHAA
jgi:hypothetical protein